MLRQITFLSSRIPGRLVLHATSSMIGPDWVTDSTPSASTRETSNARWEFDRVSGMACMIGTSSSGGALEGTGEFVSHIRAERKESLRAAEHTHAAHHCRRLAVPVWRRLVSNRRSAHGEAGRANQRRIKGSRCRELRRLPLIPWQTGYLGLISSLMQTETLRAASGRRRISTVSPSCPRICLRRCNGRGRRCL
ncbi:hypothetical protein BD413DRAFT_241338 [Trametes elegans]|nr:hypothetical protein BD413DRAFT_241338 [Trametes elegans]